MSMPPTWKRPSLARKAIEQAFGRAIDSDLAGQWDSTHLQTVTFLLDMLSDVDERILFARFSPEQSVKWRKHLAAIRAAVRRWQSGGEGGLLLREVVEVYRLLEDCPDEIVPKAERRLTFIRDTKLRTAIARDIDSLEPLLRNAQWKPATVIGGSIVEALLLDRLVRHRVRAAAAIRARVAAPHSGPGPHWPRRAPAVDELKFWQMIVVSQDIGLIGGTVAGVCEGARDYRNLIHPGVERGRQPCDEGTALTAQAAVQELIQVFSGTRR